MYCPAGPLYWTSPSLNILRLSAKSAEPMPAPATVDAFLDVLGKSGLVAEERLRLFLQQVGGLSMMPRKLAAAWSPPAC
jgi:hypothetical protein